MKSAKRIALILSAIFFLQPVMFAVDAALTKEIVALEIELTKMQTRSGQYAEMSEAALNRKIERTKKQLEKKKAKAKKEAEKDKKAIKEGAKKTGKELKEAGKEIGNTFKEIFK